MQIMELETLLGRRSSLSARISANINSFDLSLADRDELHELIMDNIEHALTLLERTNQD